MFIEKHGLWSQEQRAQAAELKKRIATEKLDLVRVAWADPHGASRAKAVSVPVFLEALASGYNINVATTTLDSAGGRVFRSFTRGGGMGLDEMTGSPNLVAVPDPATFRILPWAPNVGWILCDEYFRDGSPFHSRRGTFSKQLKRTPRTTDVGGSRVVPRRLAEDPLSDEHVGSPGLRGRPVRTSPMEPGYSYHSETNMDIMQPVLGELATTYTRLGLPLRSIENEWGPGQVECTFSAQPALRTADDLLLFRTATRQVCRRLGCFATFMARPALKCYYASGWHLPSRCSKARRTPSRQSGMASRCPHSEIRSSPVFSRMLARQPCSPRRQSTAIAASSPTRSRPTARAGASTTAAR